LQDDAYPTGAGGRFPETRHSVVIAAGQGDDDACRVAREAVIGTYWKPVYKYVRIKWNARDEEAEDLTQGFFASALDSSFFERYDPARAKFRTYLRLCLDGFVSNERKAAARIKRGGGAVHVPLDFETAEGELRRLEIAGGEDPEALFHREWVRSLFELAVDDLRRHCAETNRDVHFALFERYDLDDAPERVTYAALADAHALPVTQVTNYLAYARRQFRGFVLSRLRELSGSEAEFRAGARELLGADPP